MLGGILWKHSVEFFMEGWVTPEVKRPFKGHPGAENK
ncbi:hypothetical protein Pr1d_47900 [Bythopirellula goksoeyrii]|uniref:Uncharacterized protein n=1 Tax=Bythopirellula goksoeyrii TaxID=1400387 RepID=A0A5B9QER2_9BACT|nr:hypothetical protein Pr1d_47900 [Bythopirellula goksoeyrii]